MTAWAVAHRALHAPMIGLVGRVQRIKGQKVFLEAAEKIGEKFPKAHFVCVGRASDERRKSLLDAGREGPLKDRGHVLGEIDDIETFIATLDLGIVASLGSEGSSRITLEYMASSVPVIASKVGGIPELADLARNLDICLFEPGDSEKLSQLIEKRLEVIDPESDSPPTPPHCLEPISRKRWLDDFERLYYREAFGLIT